MPPTPCASLRYPLLFAVIKARGTLQDWSLMSRTKFRLFVCFFSCFTMDNTEPQPRATQHVFMLLSSHIPHPCCTLPANTATVQRFYTLLPYMQDLHVAVLQRSSPIATTPAATALLYHLFVRCSTIAAACCHECSQQGLTHDLEWRAVQTRWNGRPAGYSCQRRASL